MWDHVRWLYTAGYLSSGVYGSTMIEVPFKRVYARCCWRYLIVFREMIECVDFSYQFAVDFFSAEEIFEYRLCGDLCFLRDRA